MKLKTTLNYLLAVVLGLGVSAALADHHIKQQGARALTITAEATVTGIDFDAGRVTITDAAGRSETLSVDKSAVALDGISIGDTVKATYLTALEAEVREPTAEEMKAPWVVMEEVGRSGEGETPTIGAQRVIRAVCTIEGMNRLLGTVVIKDANDNVQVIYDVEPAKFEGLVLGDTVVIIYTEAMAVSLDKVAG